MILAERDQAMVCGIRKENGRQTLGDRRECVIEGCGGLIRCCGPQGRSVCGLNRSGGEGLGGRSELGVVAVGEREGAVTVQPGSPTDREFE